MGHYRTNIPLRYTYFTGFLQSLHSLMMCNVTNGHYSTHSVVYLVIDMCQKGIAAVKVLEVLVLQEVLLTKEENG